MKKDELTCILTNGLTWFIFRGPDFYDEKKRKTPVDFKTMASIITPIRKRNDSYTLDEEELRALVDELRYWSGGNHESRPTSF